MSQNQSYFWQTTRHNVYLKRTAKFHLLMALMAVLTFSTICLAEIEPNFNEDGMTVGTPTKFSPEEMDSAKVEIPDAAGNEIPSSETENKDLKSKAGFIDAFTASISVILFTELGDKTFFIAAIMAMRHPRLIVFTGAIGALALMTVLSVVFGMAATIIPKVYTYYISTALFAIFGLKMIYDGYKMKDSDAQEEMEEVQSDLRKREDELLRGTRGKYEDAEAKRKNSNSDKEEGVDDEGSAGAATTTIALPASTNANAEVKHRQRKQLNNNNLNNNISANINNNKGCELNNLDDANEAGNKENDVFLHGGSGGGAGNSLKMSTFHSSPALSVSSSSQINNCDEFSDNRNNLKDKHEFNNTTINPHRQQRMNKETLINGDVEAATPLVHSASATVLGNNNTNNSTSNNVQHAVLLNKSNGSLASGAGATNTNSIKNGLSSHSLNSAVGQSNGELKQVGGSKKRLERDVTATLIQDPESGVVRKNSKKSAAYLTTRVLMQAFTMTFVAEWGDRSQLTTIILAASKDVYGVIVGGILGHSICTGLAVIGGRIVAAKISVRTVTIVGGIVFLGFAVYALIFRPDDL